MHVGTHTHTQRERERERERDAHIHTYNTRHQHHWNGHATAQRGDAPTCASVQLHAKMQRRRERLCHDAVKALLSKGVRWMGEGSYIGGSGITLGHTGRHWCQCIQTRTSKAAAFSSTMATKGRMRMTSRLAPSSCRRAMICMAEPRSRIAKFGLSRRKRGNSKCGTRDTKECLPGQRPTLGCTRDTTQPHKGHPLVRLSEWTGLTSATSVLPLLVGSE